MKRALVLAAVLMTISSCSGVTAESTYTPTNAAADAEITRLGFHPSGAVTTLEVTLPATLDDANYGGKALACQAGGYDLGAAAGTDVLFYGVDVAVQCQGEPARVWIVVRDNQVVCAYLSARTGSSIAPGLWPVNDPGCHHLE